MVPNLNPMAGTVTTKCRLHDSLLVELAYFGGNAAQRRKRIRALKRRGCRVFAFRGQQVGTEFCFDDVER